MKIDSQEKEINSKYTFKEKGRHTVLLYIKKEGLKLMSKMFERCTKLVEISFNPYINTKNLTKIDAMFKDCISLKSVDLSLFDTEYVYDMDSMFLNCTSLTSVNLSNFNTINVNLMNSMFRDCISLKSIDLSSFNTENVFYMTSMFYNCKSLTSINLSNFNTRNVENMSLMFYNCSEIRFIDISKFTTNEKEVLLLYNLPPNGIINISSYSRNKFRDIPDDWKINYIYDYY